ncbi:hypothetical protein HAX54_033302 [Datura stramonium]|uniref:Uncharacterized protein n=1 Tax=Datura stramonium TaxID=4076 RepID=A0ABS8SE32_DATST|nr:hypothetical protein [Datura stramonium]
MSQDQPKATKIKMHRTSGPTNFPISCFRSGLAHDNGYLAVLSKQYGGYLDSAPNEEYHLFSGLLVYSLIGNKHEKEVTALGETNQALIPRIPRLPFRLSIFHKESTSDNSEGNQVLPQGCRTARWNSAFCNTGDEFGTK